MVGFTRLIKNHVGERLFLILSVFSFHFDPRVANSFVVLRKICVAASYSRMLMFPASTYIIFRSVFCEALFFVVVAVNTVRCSCLLGNQKSICENFDSFFGAQFWLANMQSEHRRNSPKCEHIEFQSNCDVQQDEHMFTIMFQTVSIFFLTFCCLLFFRIKSKYTRKRNNNTRTQNTRTQNILQHVRAPAPLFLSIRQKKNANENKRQNFRFVRCPDHRRIANMPR